MTPGELWERAWPYIAVVPGAVSLVWNVIQHFQAQGHARSLERLRADLRREIEADLLAHESHLRVRTELELRLHQRSWDLLRETEDAEVVAFEAVRLYAYAAACLDEMSKDALLANLEQNHDKADLAMRKLTSVLACVPPEYVDVRATAGLLVTCYNGIPDGALKTLDSAAPTNRDWFRATNQSLMVAHAAFRKAIRSWNATLWASQPKIESTALKV